MTETYKYIQRIRGCEVGEWVRILQVNYHMQKLRKMEQCRQKKKIQITFLV